MGKVTELTEANFAAEVLQSNKPVLVDFWAPWCGPCRMIAPVVEQLAAEYEATAKVAKINIDESPSLAASYGVSSIPTVMVFKNGEVSSRFVGLQPKTRLQDALNEALD